MSHRKRPGDKGYKFQWQSDVMRARVSSEDTKGANVGWDLIRRVALLMSHFGNDDGTSIRPKVGRLAYDLDTTPRSARRALSFIREVGVLECTREGYVGHAAHYELGESAWLAERVPLPWGDHMEDVQSVPLMEDAQSDTWGTFRGSPIEDGQSVPLPAIEPTTEPTTPTNQLPEDDPWAEVERMAKDGTLPVSATSSTEDDDDHDRWLPEALTLPTVKEPSDDEPAVYVSSVTGYRTPRVARSRARVLDI